MTDKSKAELGDTVSLNWSDGYDNATVSHVHLDGTIDVFRPYVHHSGCSYAGREGSSRVICYIGIEESKNINPDRVKVLRKAGPIK